ncbi:FAD-dependent oxidoreductase [Coprobacter sp.]
MKYLIIGGVAGGATTAARIRRNDEQAEVILFEKGKYISYANCGLPYYIGGVIQDREKLFVQTPEIFGKRFNVDVRTESEVISIDLAQKTVSVQDNKGEKYIESYDKLLLSPGAVPVRPPLPGIDSIGIFTLRNVDDTDNIKAYLQSGKVKKAVVAGGGFIGLEMAENLHHNGISVSVVEMADQVMAPVDYSTAALIHDHLLQKGVELLLNESVTSFERTDSGLKVNFKSGRIVSTDMVILSIGVRPNNTLAVNAGLKTGERGGITVNKYLQTSDKNVYAVGDAVEYPHPLTGKPWMNFLAVPANRQGRIAADNMTKGNKVIYEGAIGTAIAKVFDLTVATTGLPAKRLKQEGIPYYSSITHSGSNAGYYPGAVPMSIKITFNRNSGKLYGAQIVGYQGVDKRIDQFAQVIKHNGTVYDLIKLEHAYAPPFSSAKDPVAIAGYVAGNILENKMEPFYWRELKDLDRNKITLLDVRTADEFALCSIEGARNIPLDELRDRLDEIPQDKPIYVYCAVGLRGYLASCILRGNGWNDVKNLSGGYKTYNSSIRSLYPETPACTSDSIRDIDTQGTQKNFVKTLTVDACGLQCPGPILKLKKSIDEISIGEQVELISTDPGFLRDSSAWCNQTGHKLISQTGKEGKFISIIEKNNKKSAVALIDGKTKGKTFILFSDDLDKALATFVLANGAAATGGQVTVFFTFWGLNVIKKETKPKVKKDIFGTMFGCMLPSSSLKLKLSKMNMGGLGKRMMRFLMSKKGVDSLESMRRQALENGVEFIACQMSMDVMGIHPEELLDEVTVGGVATYMSKAEESNVNLFI